MYRVVIVDDEEPVLDSFAFILEREGEDFELCGKARSGSEAVSLITEVKPDLVFMDIQMPGLDGIDAITQIRLQYPEILFILATAYERFDIAQRAIPLGVFSYLVKPISRRMLVNELHRARIHLDQMKRRDSQQLRDYRVLRRTREEAKNRFLAGLAWGNPSPDDWELFSGLLGLKDERATIRIVEIRAELADGKRDSLLRTIHERIQFKLNCVHAVVGGRLVLYFPAGQSLERLDSHLRGIALELLPLPVAVGSGSVYHYSRLSASYWEALRSLEASTGAEEPGRSGKDEMRSICNELLHSGFERGLEAFESFWTRSFRRDSFEVAKGKMVAFFTLLMSGIDDGLLAAAHVDIDPAESIMRLDSVEAWREWSSGLVRSLRRLLASTELRSLPPHLTKALAIIHREFRRPIQLTSVAEDCQITASYLCRLFSEHLGVSFVEYLTRYRIDRATALLRDEGLSVKEASGLVGYQDPNYFSRVFRRYVGVSPSDLATRKSQ